jgi:porin
MRIGSLDFKGIRGLAAALAFLFATTNARADSTKPDISFDVFGSLPQGPNLFGDLGGLRTALGKDGITLNLTETSEVLGNVTGGVNHGADYDGLTTATLQVDSKAAFGFDGGQFNASALQIHGRNLSTDNLGVLQFVSGIEADRAARLWEIWWDQKFGEHFDVKVGQQSLDTEFMTNPSGQYFINAAFGWPELATADMPGGGPAYPLSALGVRGRAAFGAVTVLAGLYNGSPAPHPGGDPQTSDPYGLSFPLDGGVLAIAEAQYSVGDSGDAKALSGVYKVGFWYDSERFNDLRYDSSGLPLGNPANPQAPLTHQGDYGVYAVAEQMIWRGSEAERTLSAFVRPMFTPLRDRNLVAFSANGGLALKDPLPCRKNDTAAIGFAYAHVSAAVTGYSLDAATYNPAVYTPRRGDEIAIEATYQYQATPWWQLQPDLQYVVNPGGGIADPDAPTRRIGNEWVVGLRTNITF